jgi:g-D-glutamyl-meso-diaminopimelate peptidase
MIPKPSSGKKPSFELGGFSGKQTNILIGLTLTSALVLIFLCALISAGMKNPYKISPTLDPTLLTPLPLPTFPSTWTPEPTQTPLPRNPTATPAPSFTPLPSFTPYTLYPTEVSGSNILPFEKGGDLVAIGTSVAGRPLQVIRFGTGPSNRMIVADIHGGNEWNTTALADQLIGHLKTHPELIPANDSLYILRSLNPDGLARDLGIDGRVNDHGVDLNRNWDAGWQKDWNRDGCWNYAKTTGGDFPNSEPETQALAKFVLSIPPVDALISYHSAALGIFPGGLPPDDASKRFAQQIADVTTYPYPGTYTGCVYAGGLVDWMSLQGIPAADVELSTHSSTDFDMNLQVLNVILNFQK